MSTEVNNNLMSDTGPRTVEVKDSEEWVCVARLPLDISSSELREVLSEFGRVEECFLVTSEKTGRCKGYGLARFGSACAALQARHVLDGQEIRGHKVECGFLPEGTYTRSDLQSKVLYVDKLPEGYKDMTEFRKIFSKLVSPPYCQIAVKNGIVQSWGLVEYNSWEEAENVVEMLRGNVNIKGQPVRIEYAIPGIHAITIYMNFVNNPAERGERRALLDDSPGQDVYAQLKALARHNPGFVQSLHAIVTQNILAGGPDTDSVASSLLLNGLRQAGGNDILQANKAGGISSPPPAANYSPGQSYSPPVKSAAGQPNNTKDPTLMNMLFSSFQARLSKNHHAAAAGGTETQVNAENSSSQSSNATPTSQPGVMAPNAAAPPTPYTHSDCAATGSLVATPAAPQTPVGSQHHQQSLSKPPTSADGTADQMSAVNSHLTGQVNPAATSISVPDYTQQMGGAVMPAPPPVVSGQWPVVGAAAGSLTNELVNPSVATGSPYVTTFTAQQTLLPLPSAAGSPFLWPQPPQSPASILPPSFYFTATAGSYGQQQQMPTASAYVGQLSLPPVPTHLPPPGLPPVHQLLGQVGINGKRKADMDLSLFANGDPIKRAKLTV